MRRPRAHGRPRTSTADLQQRLQEAEQALDAIRTGKVESLVVDGPEGPRIFSLEGASHAYRVLVEAMNEGAATLGLDGTILYCNARLARMLATPLQEVVGSALAAWVAPGSTAALEALLREARGADGRAELCLLARGGEEIPVLLSASGIQDQGRAVLCAVATDLREQRRQERVVASELFARSILEQAADAIVVCDESGRIVRTSRAAERLCGRNPLRMRFAEAFPVKLGIDEGATLAEVALSGVTVSSAPASMPSPDGGMAELLASSAPLHGQGEERLGFVITLVDITAQRRDEAQLEAALGRAEQGEAQKEAALQALREADRNKTHFLAMLSHELRNPLEPIRNCVYILENAPPGGEEAARARRVIQRQTQHMARLIDDLLDMTRISRGKVQLLVAPVDLREVVLRTIEDHRPAFEAGGIELHLAVPEERLVVQGDRIRLAQILGNLLQNVAKFTPRGGQAWVSLARDEHGNAALRVRDDGVGIPGAMLPRLFEPFSQADETLDRSRGGLGLGLSLVRALVELHGGQVSVDSAGLHRGTEVILQLPLSPVAVEPVAARSAAGVRDRRVLVIEDNVDSAETIQDVLQMAGHRVEVARTGPDGIERAREFTPDIVLCDIGLPGMDGFAVARAFREDPNLRTAYLVALSGYATPDDVARAQAAGFDRHLAKPVDAEALQELIGAGELSPGVRHPEPNAAGLRNPDDCVHGGA